MQAEQADARFPQWSRAFSFRLRYGEGMMRGTACPSLLTEMFPDARSTDSARIEDLPASKGAYLLALHLPTKLAVKLRGKPHRLASGWYAYAGSAHGPGGVKARLRRHFAREKKLHWHIDQVSVAADHAMAFVIPEGSECEIVARLAATGQASFPIEGFGSSDCRICYSHLLSLGD